MTDPKLRALADDLTRLLEQRGARREGEELRFPCPKPEHHANGDAHWSARWHPEKGVWRCDVSGEGAGTLNLRWLLFMNRDASWSEASSPRSQHRRTDRTGHTDGAQRETGRWPLRDIDGHVVAVHVRLEPGHDGRPKDCVWFGADGCTRGLGGQKVSDLPLYGAHELAGADRSARVVLVEGEKARDTLTQHGVMAVGTVTGASGMPADDVLRVLEGWDVVLWTDADKPGRAHMQRISARLAALGIAHRLIDPWPDATDGRDAADFTGTDEEFAALVSEPRLPGNLPAQVGVLLAEVTPEAVRWQWEGRLPFGKLVILEGRPDEGKTTLALDVAARVSTGAAMPLETAERMPRGVVVLTAEDGLADTIRPRLEAAGADLTRIVAAPLDELPTLDEAGLNYIRALVDRVEAGLIVIDPLMAFVPDGLDTHRDHHSRRLLRKFSALAEDTGATVLVLRHLRKGTAVDAKDAGGGSVGFTAAARVVLLAAVDPEDDTRRVLARVKGNLSAPFASLGYRLVGTSSTVRLEWLGETSHTAAGLLAVPLDAEARAAGAEAVDFLHAYLADGPKGAKDVRRAAREAGIADRTLDRAKARAGVSAYRTGGLGKDGSWEWALKDATSAKNAVERQPPNGASLEHRGILRGTNGSDASVPVEGEVGDDAAKETPRPVERGLL
jgi:putative DNA primase/helicase